MAQLMARRRCTSWPRRWPGNPLALARCHGSAPIQRHRQLGPHSAATTTHSAINPGITSRASASSRPTFHLNTGTAQFLQPLPPTMGLGSCIAATTRLTPAAIKASAQGPVLPDVGTGFQSHVGSCTAGVPRLCQGFDFSVIATGRLGETLSDHLRRHAPAHSPRGGWAWQEYCPRRASCRARAIMRVSNSVAMGWGGLSETGARLPDASIASRNSEISSKLR